MDGMLETTNEPKDEEYHCEYNLDMFLSTCLLPHFDHQSMDGML